MWILDLTTSIGASFLALVGVVLLARSGPVRNPTSAGHWFGIAVLLFVTARFLHLPGIEDQASFVAGELLGHYNWHNIPYVLTITCTTVAIVYCVPAVAWLVGADVKPLVPHLFAGGSSAIMLTAFITSGLWRQPEPYLPDAFEWNASQVIFWGYIALAIAGVGIISLGLILGNLREFTGPIRVMMLLIASSAITAVVFALHIVLRVFIIKAAPGLFPEAYARNGSLIAVALTTLVTVQLLAAFLVPLLVRLWVRIQYFQMLWDRHDEWVRSRQLEHRNVFEHLQIPQTRLECWRAARTPVIARRMLFEMSTV